MIERTNSIRRIRNVLLCLLTVAIFIFAETAELRAQWIGRQTGCSKPAIVANPNRPTIANPADTTQYGVLELEYGWDRTWPGRGVHQHDFGGLLKFGMLCDIELRWTTTSFISQTDTSGTQSGFGDNWLGPQIRFYRQTTHIPALAFSYAAKFLSASPQKGLGSGRVDHGFTFLASKDLLGTHFDGNATYFMIGRTNSSGFDHYFQMNISFSRTLRGPLGITGELYGNTRLNAATPGFVSTLWALTVQVSPRLVLDGGIDAGLTAGAPHKRVFVGVTYSIADLYSAVKRARRSGKTPAATSSADPK
jgi:hypothetical protein